MEDGCEEFDLLGGGGGVGWDGVLKFFVKDTVLSGLTKMNQFDTKTWE